MAQKPRQRRQKEKTRATVGNGGDGRLPLNEPVLRPSYRRERRALGKGIWPVAGCDEAGRGPLAGPVVAAAVVLDPERIPRGLNDSKKL
ncbi:MAG TPA: ribonuclease HII, partial [Pseudolabrys sp.]|nr:ribonuclease HII [Pseudolabrys sp.]